MCSINGLNFEDRDLLDRMNSVTRHRGPDSSGSFFGSRVSLGQNRLSIIDLSDNGRQPMFIDDGNLVVVFNGEIYNYQELKGELPDYPFKSNSDTEAILAAYKKWGRNCLNRFNGIFAFAIWDRQREELFMARDHLGVKPLYYYYDGKRFLFSSEIKAILEDASIDRSIDPEALGLYFRILYTPEPLTLFKNVKKLPQACYAVLNSAGLKVERYWQADLRDDKKSSAEWAGLISTSINSAIKRQLVSDRPLGIYLSGGLDSSIILNGVAKLRSGIDTFSVGFKLQNEQEEAKFNFDYELADRTAKFYGARHHAIRLETAYVVDNFEKMIWHMDEPISNPTAIAFYRLSEVAKQTVDVVLSGDGGDELFGGYDRYRFALIMRYFQRLPAAARNILIKYKKIARLNVDGEVNKFLSFIAQKKYDVARIFKDKTLADRGSRIFDGFLSQDTAIDFEKRFMDADRRTWLVDFDFMLTDKMSMAHALEARVPLLDREVVDLANSIPFSEKVTVFKNKKIYRQAFCRELPPWVVKQPKRGFLSPGAKWLREDGFSGFVREILSDGYYPEINGLIDGESVRLAFNNHLAKQEYNLSLIWAVLTFKIWAKVYGAKT